MKLTHIAAAVAFSLAALTSFAADYPAPQEGTFIVKDFQFKSGERLPEVKLHYYTMGKPRKDANGKVTNAVLVLHGTGGTGRQFLSPNFAGVLFVPGGLLDASKYFIVLPDNVGHGGSSKPSDGLHMRFPHYEYDDMIELQYRLLTQGLGINHMRLIMGTSMGDVLLLMGSSALRMQKEYPTREKADAFLDQFIAARSRTTDANDMLYYFDASRNYNPEPQLEKIIAPLTAVNSADDVINPPELKIIDADIQRVKNGKYVLLPITNETRGHGTHTWPAIWKEHLAELLKRSER